MTVISKRESRNAVATDDRTRFGIHVDWARGLPAVMGFAVVSVVGYSAGGFYPRTWRLSMLALLALSAAVLIARERIEISRREWGFVGAMAGLTAWTAASYYWSIHPSHTLFDAERTPLYLVALLTVLLGATQASLAWLLIGALAGTTAVSAYALAFYVFLSPPIPDAYQGWHLFEPFGYANAAGIYAVLGILLTIGLALWARSWPARAAILLPLLVFVPALYYTSSRGAWMALPGGLVATLYLGRRMRSRGLLLALLAGALVIAFALGSERGQGFSLLGEHRPMYWRIAWEDVETNPLLGSGAGTFGRFLSQHSSTPYYAHDVHNLYLETLAELGPVGLGLLVAFLVLPLLALRGPPDSLVAAAGGVYIAFLIHAGVDWDWEFPSVTLLGLLGAVGLLVGRRPDRLPELSAGAGATLLVVVALAACFLVLRLEMVGQLGLRT